MRAKDEEIMAYFLVLNLRGSTYKISSHGMVNVTGSSASGCARK